MEGHIRIGIIEDSDALRDIIKSILEASDGDYDVVAEAVTLEDGLRVIDESVDGTNPVDIVTLDGKLDGEQGEDARRIVEHAKARGFLGAIIGASSEKMEDQGVEVTYDLGKMNLARLPEVIRDIL